MRSSLYHFRRLLISCAFEVLVRLMSWAASIRKRYLTVVLFALACIICGTAFLLWPEYMAGLFGFEAMNAVALTDVRAYYGGMLVALGLVLAWLASNDAGGRAALLVIIAFAGGSALGRLLGFALDTPLLSIHGLLTPVELGLAVWCVLLLRYPPASTESPLPPLNPKTPEDFQPLSAQHFRDPYRYYRMLRDKYPLYYMKERGFYILSRYEDITHYCKETELMSNKLVEILATGRPKLPGKTSLSAVERLGEWGILPVDVLALQDPPVHTAERKVGHAGFNARLVKQLEDEVELLCDEMMNEFLPQGNVEFVQQFAWRLPMRLIIRLLGFPEQDYNKIKWWCEDGIRALSGTLTPSQQIATGITSAQFMRYLWRHYLDIKKRGADNFTGRLAAMADDPGNIMTDQRVVATLLQLLIAGSDSSASSMASAIRVMVENPDIEQRLRARPEDIPLFIEEVFRTESAFQGHFRLTTKPCVIHGVELPAASRIFMLWASGNRDERFWGEDAERFNMDRPNVKKHLTFGHGIHACLGRELARMEIRIVIGKLLERTSELGIVGPVDYEASLFARTLTRLPLAFERA